MKASPASAAAMALASIYGKNPDGLEGAFGHLTPSSLERLDGWMTVELQKNHSDEVARFSCHRVVAQAAIRRIVHRCIEKYKNVYPLDVTEAALKYHTLPNDLQQKLVNRYGGESPSTWYQALERLKILASTKGDDDYFRNLWQLVMEHPMTSYVPFQCWTCGHVVPDVRSSETDTILGLMEQEPTGTELGLQGGWFLGRPRGPKLLQLHCPKCHNISTWYRSGHPQIVLNPNRWGRLCGEQEELRLSLAKYLDIPLRMILPLDWDHVWNEFRSRSQWETLDADARNFCCRLDDNIGSWTGIWAIHPDPSFCQDVTNEYLTCLDYSCGRGRADSDHEPSMPRYRQTVHSARKDLHCTQAGTVNGYVLQRAGFTEEAQITQELQQAACDFGNRKWWQVPHD